MNRTVYVNGEFVAEEEAKVSIFDRGFLFADGVYEVSSVLNGSLIDNQRHLKRLRRSLGELEMELSVDDGAIEAIQNELIRLNRVDEGLVYLQVTRGVADRDFAYPDDSTSTFILFTQKRPLIDCPQAMNGIKVITTEDIRWARRDIKSVGLLAACMAKMLAKKAGADDAWMYDQDGYITEGSSSNAYIVTKKHSIVTRHLTSSILHGITRHSVLNLAAGKEMKVEERPFSKEEAYGAKEAFVTSASTFVWPVVAIDNIKIGAGEPGPVAQQLRQLYINQALGSQ